MHQILVSIGQLCVSASSFPKKNVHVFFVANHQDKYFFRKMEQTTYVLVIVSALMILGYAVYKQTQTLGQTRENDGQNSKGSGWAFFFLILIFVVYALVQSFNYVYDFLGPWDPLGIYQRNRNYMGIAF